MIQPAKVTHFTEQGYKIKGIIHVGMNDGEEVPSYKELGIKHILGFEPMESQAKIAKKLYNVDVELVALSDEDTMKWMYVTAGDKKGSSLFKLNKNHPELEKWRDNDVVVGKELIQTLRFDSWVKGASRWNKSNYDCLVLDTQGNEWEVLHGFGNYLDNFKYLSVELSEDPVYKGEHKGQTVINWLVKNGWTQDSELQSHNDVFFVRSDIKPTSDRIYYGLA